MTMPLRRFAPQGLLHFLYRAEGTDEPSAADEGEEVLEG